MPASNAYSEEKPIELGATIMATELNQDYPFKGTTILIITHSDLGTVGVLLGLELTKDMISNSVTQNCMNSNLHFFLGGLNNVAQPIELSLPEDYLLNPIPIEIIESTVRLSDISAFCNANHEASIFFGIEFWSPREIDDEIKAGLWAVTKYNSYLK